MAILGTMHRHIFDRLGVALIALALAGGACELPPEERIVRDADRTDADADVSDAGPDGDDGGEPG